MLTEKRFEEIRKMARDIKGENAQVYYAILELLVSDSFIQRSHPASTVPDLSP